MFPEPVSLLSKQTAGFPISRCQTCYLLPVPKPWRLTIEGKALVDPSSNERRGNISRERTTPTHTTMEGRPQKTRKGKPKKTPTEGVTSETVSPQSTEESDAVPCSDLASVSQPTASVLQSRPKRGRGQRGQIPPTYTSVNSSSTDTLSNKSEQTQSETNSPAQRRRGRKRKIKRGGTTSERSRPRFELDKPDAAEQDESLLSSDLSIELSHHEEQLLNLSFQDDENSDEDEEEELPSFLMEADKKPPTISEGVFVWSKFRNYPFWPAMVKSVHRKQKKASIMFIDDTVTFKTKGLTVALKTLKPFDCEEANELVCTAKEKYNAAIKWSLELIKDYRIRIACGSFSGSFVEYFAHDMSYPVRRMYPQTASERLTIASDTRTEVPSDHHEDDSEQKEKVNRSSKRLLPDRSHAAHNRANEKLVHFIVKQRMVEERLLAVIRGQQQSRWLCSFRSASRRRVVNIYLEDDQQLDQVYWYLNELYATEVASALCLPEVKAMERVPFVLDVLLPEAIIYAIAGVDNIPIKKAEEKYLRGRCISNRERQEFDLMIERQMKKKSQPALVSDTVS